ncbi:MAG TPA: FAD-binding protein, partial [Solirubrobacteraceae bacterium]|nr:FAD-binding protein [Solirubrobacteraceae bacterium]
MGWDSEFDVVVVGTGGGALTAAVTASWRGLKTLVVEKTSTWGGTTAYSGGGVWIPANPLMIQDGVNDSLDDALRYLDDIVGEVGPASSPERRRALLQGGPEMIAFLSGLGVRWQRVVRYPDYYPER